MKTIDVPMTADATVGYDEIVDLHFTTAGTFSDTDHKAFKPPLPSGKHFKKGQYSRRHKADNSDHDDRLNLALDQGGGSRTMGTIHVRNVDFEEGRGIEDTKQRELDTARDVAASAQDLVNFVLTTLKPNADERAVDQPRFFFPGGIDSISVTVTVGLTTVEVSASGPGPNGSSSLPSKEKS